MVTTNAGRAVYIVYSLLTIPIMTILISMMSDTFLAKFQKGAEKLGIRGGEDQRFNEHQEPCQEVQEKRSRSLRKLFRRRVRKPLRGGNIETPPPAEVEKDVDVERDVEKGEQEIPSVGDDILREEILEEVESIEQSVNESVDSQLGIAGKKHPAETVDGDLHNEEERKPIDVIEDDDDDGICEEDVDLAIQESRRHT